MSNSKESKADISPRTPRIWEPLIAIAIAVMAIAFTGCMEQPKTESTSFPITKSECQATAVPNSYVIHWRDGSVSVARGWTRDDFKKEIFEPHQKDILLAEQDQRIQIQPHIMNSIHAETTADDTWGQTMIAAPAAWAAGINGAGVTVAVVDSGVDITHPQLKNQLAVNTGEIPGNGIDDDGNGYIDDIYGWDFDKHSPVMEDTAGHGTHVAGIILAEHSSGAIQGIAPAAKLLPLDFMNKEGSGQIGDAILAIHYAADRGAKVINASWGGAPCSATLQKTIDELSAKGVLFLAAAGNYGVDLDQEPEYPAAFVSPSQITVGASTARNYTASFSNYSFKLVHLFAPGTEILSTFPGNRVAALSGTSMATPFVSGAAALLFSAHPDATVAQVKEALLGSVDSGDFAAVSQGRLNIKKALELIAK